MWYHIDSMCYFQNKNCVMTFKFSQLKECLKFFNMLRLLMSFNIVMSRHGSMKPEYYVILKSCWLICNVKIRILIIWMGISNDHVIFQSKSNSSNCWINIYQNFSMSCWFHFESSCEYKSKTWEILSKISPNNYEFVNCWFWSMNHRPLFYIS